MGDEPGQITVLLGRMADGDRGARDALVPLVYRDLEKIAAGYANRPGVSLEPCGLVHELYVRLAMTPLQARDRKHFYSVAALAMRQILVDRARRKRARKRGGDVARVTIDNVASAENMGVDVVIVDDALRRLEELAPRQARIIELRCLVGLSLAETAEVIGVSQRTVSSEWRLARAWIVRALQGEQTRTR
ncbi:MAG TPA: ECF-type sigma factor [Kofleriaceae bacterium]|jgi:RNA polymerase sigma factor (TIGR02999 family)|nr:ECF-type sigma factor [Kofleriaceae bacterium]